jgi:hypothetical protein
MLINIIPLWSRPWFSSITSFAALIHVIIVLLAIFLHFSINILHVLTVR